MLQSGDSTTWGAQSWPFFLPAFLPRSCVCGCSLPWHMCERSTLGPTGQDGGDFKKCLWVVFGVFFSLTSFKRSSRFLGEPGVEECPKQGPLHSKSP